VTTQRALDGATIRGLVAELAERLHKSRTEYRLVIAGGALLAWHGLRESTHDVDSLTFLDEAIRTKIAEVAAEHDLAINWLNHNARPFTPATLETESCADIFVSPQLTLLGVPLHMVFLMKLDRANPGDVADMIALWPHVREEFSSFDDVARRYFDAYPLAREDAYLASFIEQIARESGE